MRRAAKPPSLSGWDRPRWALFLLLFATSAFVHAPVEYDNTLSREYLLSSAVDYRRLDLGVYARETVDVSESGGRVYSNKAVGLPLLAAPVYWLLRAGPLRSRGPLSPESVYLCRLWAVTLPHALAGPVLYELLLGLGAAAEAAFLAVVAFGLGTIAWLHAAQFSGHETAGSLELFAFAAARALSAERRDGAGAWFGAGLLAGLGALCEFQAAWIAVVLAAYAAARAPSRRALAAFAAGGAACLAVLLAYDLRCFGSPFTLSYARQGAAFADASRSGFLGVGLPSPEVSLRLLFSPSRGLFFVSPVLLFALPGFAALRRRPELKAETSAIAAAAAGAFALNAGYANWHAGWSFGPRYLASVLPFLIVPAAFAIERAWFAALFLASFAQLALAQASTPYAPQAIENPVVELLAPLFARGYRADDLGSLCGLDGAARFVPGLVLIGALVAWGLPRAKSAAGRASPRWGWLYGAALAGIAAGLAAFRTPDPRAPRMYAAKLLEDLNDERPSDAIRAAAAEEKRAYLVR